MNNLEDIKGVGPSTAEKLRKIGIGTITALAQANPTAVGKETRLPVLIISRLIQAAKGSIEPSEEAVSADRPVEPETQDERTIEQVEAQKGEVTESTNGALPAEEIIPVEKIIEEEPSIGQVETGGVEARERNFLFKEELVLRAMQMPHIRKGIINKIVKNLFD